MKKIILSAIAIFVFGFVSAQLREKGTIEIIPQIGISTSLYNGNDTYRFDFNSPSDFNSSSNFNHY